MTTKKDLYEKVFQTSDYFCYDPDTEQFLGWTLLNQYVALEPNEHGWRWSRRLGLWLGLWEGEYLKKRAVWLRFYDTEGKLVLTKDEAADQRAETERQRAETERRRAEQAQAENERLRARLRELGVDPDGVL